MSIWTLFKSTPRVTAKELAEMLLEECRQEMLHEAEQWEQHAANYQMLRQREFRLSREVHRLSQNPVAVSPPKAQQEDPVK